MNTSKTAIKLGLLGTLYFSQGLPFGFFTQALPVMLREKGFSLEEIGLTSLLALPWALKFLWAPLVDRYSFKRIGKRRSWILPLQFSAVAVLLALAAWFNYESMNVLMVAVFVLNLIAATQDIATDGLAVDMLKPEERGFANGLQVAGYRVGMIVGGGALLILHERLGTTGTFLAMAVLTAMATIPIWMTRESPQVAGQSGEEKKEESPWQTFLNFFHRPGVWRVLALVVLYKAGDAFATSMLRPFLVDEGLTLEDIGWLLGTVGFVASLVGALLGGALVNVMGRKSALFWFGIAQALSVAGYACLAAFDLGSVGLYTLCAVEHLVGGMATAALFTCMMDWCSKESSATDYTTQASAVVIATGVASTVAGASAGALGYLGHFVLGTVLALGSALLVLLLFPTAKQAFSQEVPASVSGRQEGRF